MIKCSALHVISAPWCQAVSVKLQGPLPLCPSIFLPVHQALLGKGQLFFLILLQVHLFLLGWGPGTEYRHHLLILDIDPPYKGFFFTLLVLIIFFTTSLLHIIFSRGPLPKDPILYDKYKGKWVAGYDYPRTTSVVSDQVHKCCGLLRIKAWGVKHWGCTDATRPVREHLVESETEYCGVCCKHCPNPADYMLHHEHSHLCAPMFVCLICHFPYITHTALTMHITEIHGGLVSAQKQLSFNYNF